MSISVRKLAELTNLSPVAVSRALRGRDGVSEATRNRVLAAARKHHCPIPRTTRQGPDLLNTLCSMLAIDADEDRSGKGFHRRILSGATVGASSCATELMNWTNSQGFVGPTEWPLAVNRRQADGVVLVLGDEALPHPPFPAPVPVVFIFAGPSEADVVTVENFDAGYRLGEHLAGLGHRRVAYIGPTTGMSVKRLAGLRVALEKAGGTVPPEGMMTKETIGSRDDAVRAIDRMLDGASSGNPGAHRFTALMAYNDYMAAAAVMRLRERGVRVPEDMSVVGFDNVRPIWYEGPALTTTAMPLEDIGAEAVRLLYWRLAHIEAPRRKLVLTAQFVQGKTTGPAAAANLSL